MSLFYAEWLQIYKIYESELIMQYSENNTLDLQVAKNFLFWHLPYNVRRFIEKKRKYTQFNRLQNQRIETTNHGYSFKPFVENKCIFIHVPKAAGVSVSMALFNNLSGGHTSLDTYQIVFTKKEFDSFFKFTFVRNPWDRLVSAFHFLKEEGFSQQDKVWANENISKYDDFETFVREWVTPENVKNYWHFIPQHHFICLPYRNKPGVDFLGFFENIEEDFNHVKDMLGIRSNLSKSNTTRHRKKEYIEYYTDETRKIVEEVYRKDVEILGYNFDNSSILKQIRKRRSPK